MNRLPQEFIDDKLAGTISGLPCCHFDRSDLGTYIRVRLYNHLCTATAGDGHTHEGRQITRQSLPRVLRRLLSEYESQYGDGTPDESRDSSALLRAGQKELSVDE